MVVLLYLLAALCLLAVREVAALTSRIELLEAGAGGVVAQAGSLAESTDGFFG